MSLKCQRFDCIYNDQGGDCFSANIMIKGRMAQTTSGTTCESYVLAEGLQNYEFAYEFLDVNQMPSDTPNIKCDARNCKFNINRACKATTVEINKVDASCETFEV